MVRLIDAHVHLDHYKDDELEQLMTMTNHVETLISVSFHLDSCKKNLLLAEKFEKVKPAFGFHPEQTLPSDQELKELLNWIKENQDKMVAIGEVVLPYYLRTGKNVVNFSLERYLEVLEQFILLSKQLNKPIVLHAVYDDAPIVCTLLEKHSVTKAHFHWFKGDYKTIERMKNNGYFVSVTPDILYEKEIQELVRCYPLEQLMVETDGPWAFEGPFKGTLTNPNMMKDSIKIISQIKKLTEPEVLEQIYRNTKNFYGL